MTCGEPAGGAGHPLVSRCVRALGEVLRVAQAILSVERVADEVGVVNSGSTDGTVELPWPVQSKRGKAFPFARRRALSELALVPVASDMEPPRNGMPGSFPATLW